jgi:hypothetical protein
MIKTCEELVTEVSAMPGKKSGSNASWRKISWALTGKGNMAKMQVKLEAHKSARNLTLMLVTT